MPSISREALVELFRNRPELAPELLRDVLHVELPEYAEIRLEDSDLTQLRPIQFKGDLVVLLRKGTPVMAIVLEAQLSEDPDKLYSWLVYLAVVRARYRCPTIVLVVATTERVARWASQVCELGGAHTWAPHVVGPTLVPVITENDVAASDPELAVLSALAHGNDPNIGTAVSIAALSAAANLDAQRGSLYHDVILANLGDAARTALEKLMASGYVFQTDFAKKHQAIGKAEGKVEALLRVLDARGLQVTSEDRARIAGESDLELLDRWLTRAVAATSTNEVLSG